MWLQHESKVASACALARMRGAGSGVEGLACECKTGGMGSGSLAGWAETDQASASHGLMTGTPAAKKGAVSRVATVNPHTDAIAAI